MSLQTFNDLIYLPAFILAIVVGLKTRYKYKVSKPRCLVYLVVSLFYAFLMAELSGKVYNAIMRSVKHVETYQNRAIFGAILLTPLCIIATVLLGKAARNLFNRVLKSKQSDEKRKRKAIRRTGETVRNG